MVAVLWALSLMIQSLGGFHESLLKRQLRFGAVTIVKMTGMLAGAIAAIVAASSGAGHLALLLQFVVWDAVRWAVARTCAGGGPTDR